MSPTDAEATSTAGVLPPPTSGLLRQRSSVEDFLPMDLLEGDFSRCLRFSLWFISATHHRKPPMEICNASPHQDSTPPFVLPSTPEMPQFFVCHTQDT